MKELITEIRKSKMVNQKEFAELLGISESMLSRLESGDRRPGRKAIKALVTVANRNQARRILNELRDNNQEHEGG